MPGVARPSANLAGRQWPFQCPAFSRAGPQWPFQCPAFSRAGRLLAKPQPGQFGGFGAIAENPRSPNERLPMQCRGCSIARIGHMAYGMCWVNLFQDFLSAISEADHRARRPSAWHRHAPAQQTRGRAQALRLMWLSARNWERM